MTYELVLAFSLYSVLLWSLCLVMITKPNPVSNDVILAYAARMSQDDHCDILVGLHKRYGIRLGNKVAQQAFEIYEEELRDNYDNDDYKDMLADSQAEVLANSPLYNKMVSLNGKTKRKLINVLVNQHGDLRESVTLQTFKNLNAGRLPLQSSIIPYSNLGNNINAGKVDIYTAVDSIYSELGYQSGQAMLDDIEQIRGMK